MSRLGTIAAFAVALIVGLLWWRLPDPAPVRVPSAAASPAPISHASDDRSPIITLNVPGVAPIDGVSHLADALNALTGTIQADLHIVADILESFRSNFPYAGNPVGDNAEITAALTGANVLKLALVPKNHPAIDSRGQLCDRWGTPFFFHQLSGTQMEIRSAGPDRKFGSDDDVIYEP
jgi:hypothetical protein